MMLRWVTEWACAQCDCRLFISPLPDKTLRCRFKSTSDGEALRFLLSNFYGSEPVRIEKATVTIGEACFRLTAGGRSGFTVAALQSIRTDPVKFRIYAGDEVEICFYVKDDIISGSMTQTGEHSVVGDYTAPGRFIIEPNQRTVLPQIPEAVFQEPLMLVQAMEILTGEESFAVAAFGDSITQMGFWFNPLRDKLLNASSGRITALNLGISGNRLLRSTPDRCIFGEAFGDSALIRVYQDILTLSGVSKVIIALGVNDISQPGTDDVGGKCVDEMPSFGQMARGYKILKDVLEKNGIQVYGATITPFEGYSGFNEGAESLRNQVNEWMRGKEVFEHIIDFDQAICDPFHKSRIRPEYDSGDHLHPNETGGRAMFDRIPVDGFTDR